MCRSTKEAHCSWQVDIFHPHNRETSFLKSRPKQLRQERLHKAWARQDKTTSARANEISRDHSWSSMYSNFAVRLNFPTPTIKSKSFVLTLLLLTRARWQHKNRVLLQHLLGKAKFPLFCLELPGLVVATRKHYIGRQSVKGDAFTFIDQSLTNSCRKWAIHHGLSCILH